MLKKSNEKSPRTITTILVIEIEGTFYNAHMGLPLKALSDIDLP